MRRHTNPSLAEEVAKAGAIEQLSLCIEDPETSLKKIATMALSEIAKHNAELADRIANNAGTLRVLSGCLADRDWELRQYACTCLANVAKHNEDLAQKVAGADVFTRLINCVKDEKEKVQVQAVICIREIAHHSIDLAKVVCDVGGVIPYVVDYLSNAPGFKKLPAITTLGYVSGFEHDLARSVVQCKGHIALVGALRDKVDDSVKAAAAWSLGQIGRHSSELAKELAEQKVLSELLILYMAAEEKSDIKKKTRKALKSIIQQCQEIEALRPLLEVASEKMLKHIVAQIAIILKSNPAAKRPFAEKGSLKKLLEIHPPPESKLQSAINEINDLFPPEVTQHYSPEYMNTLLKKIDEPSKEPAKEQVKEPPKEVSKEPSKP